MLDTEWMQTLVCGKYSHDEPVYLQDFATLIEALLRPSPMALSGHNIMDAVIDFKCHKK